MHAGAQPDDIYLMLLFVRRYTPQLFSDVWKHFMKEAKEQQHASYAEARNMWKQSPIRAALLDGMSHGELCRRRFI